MMLAQVTAENAEHRDGNRSGRPVGSTGRVVLPVRSTLGDRCVTGRPHEMQMETFLKYKRKTEIHLLHSLRLLIFRLTEML